MSVISYLSSASSERFAAMGTAIARENPIPTSNNTRRESRGWFKIGPNAVPWIRLHFFNGYVQAGEKGTGNAVPFGVAIERLDVPTTVQVPIAGSTSYYSLASNAYVSTDQLAASSFGLSNFPANSVWRWRTDVVLTTAGHRTPSCFYSTTGKSDLPIISGETSSVTSNSGTSQLLNTGNLTTPSGGTVDLRGFAPCAITGPHGGVAIYAMGDSMVWGQDAPQYSDVAGGSFFCRGIRDAGLPFVAGGIPSERAMYWASGNTFRKFLFTFATHMLDNTGGADGLAGRTYAQVEADLKATWLDFRNAAIGPKYIVHSQVQPITTGGANWSNGSQTPTAATIRNQFNTGMVSIAGTSTGPNAIFYSQPYFQDSVNTDIWRYNGTAFFYTPDGIHQTDNSASDAGAAITTLVGTFTA